MDDAADNPYDSPTESDRAKYDQGAEEYAPLVIQWGLIVWTVVLMGLLTVMVLAVEMIPSGN